MSISAKTTRWCARPWRSRATRRPPMRTRRSCSTARNSSWCRSRWTAARSATGEYALGEESLAIATVPQRFTLETVSRIRPQQNTGAGRPVRLEHRLFHAVRGAGLSPHHLVHRPARRDGALHQHHPRRARALSGAAVERQPRRRRARRQAGATGRNGRIRSPSPPISSPWSRRSWRGSKTRSSPAPDARPSLPSTSSRASSTSAASPCAA